MLRPSFLHILILVPSCKFLNSNRHYIIGRFACTSVSDRPLCQLASVRTCSAADAAAKLTARAAWSHASPCSLSAARQGRSEGLHRPMHCHSSLLKASGVIFAWEQNVLQLSSVHAKETPVFLNIYDCTTVPASALCCLASEC